MNKNQSDIVAELTSGVLTGRWIEREVDRTMRIDVENAILRYMVDNDLKFTDKESD